MQAASAAQSGDPFGHLDGMCYIMCHQDFLIFVVDLFTFLCVCVCHQDRLV